MALRPSSRSPRICRVAICHRLALFTIVGLMVPFTGCGGGSPASSSPPAPTNPLPTPTPSTNPAVTAAKIYSIDLASQSVDVYAANGNGTVSPSSSYPGGGSTVTGDAAGNIYIGTSSSTLTAVVVYPAGSTTASRNITVATAAVNSPQILTLAVDSANNLYAAVGGSILVYGPAASGAATPIRTITGALTTLAAASPITQMAFDADDNLFVAMGAGYKGSQVVEFAAGTAGNVAPTIITSSDYFPDGVALDSAGNIYISQGTSPSAGNGVYSAAVYVFPKGSVAGATPARTITGSNAGFNIYSDGLFVDAGGNIFVGTVEDGQTDFLVFSATANGNVAPASTLFRSKGSTTDTQFFVR